MQLVVLGENLLAQMATKDPSGPDILAELDDSVWSKVVKLDDKLIQYVGNWLLACIFIPAINNSGNTTAP